MLIRKYYDCADKAAGFTYTSWNFACFNGNALPDVLFADIGPVVVPTCSPDCLCYNFPLTGSIRVGFERITPCDWSSGQTIVWVCSAFDYPLTLFVNPYQKIFQENASIPVISSVFSFSGDPSPTGSCFYDPQTGQSSGSISGVATLPPQACSCSPGCLLSYTLYFGTPP